MPEEDVLVSDVKALQTRGGNTRFVLVDDEGREFSTFKEGVAHGLPELKGHRARIRYHEVQRGEYTNVYLDAAELLEEPEGDSGSVPPEELFERLKPFKELVAEDIEGRPDDEED
jgi:hypothetical protein